jgi:phosphate-selective porin OprO/OprP
MLHAGTEAINLAIVCLTLGVHGVGSFALASDTMPEEPLRERLSALEAEVRALRDTEASMSEARASEIRTLVHEVLADADTRSSLLADEYRAGYDGRFFISSPDTGFQLNLGGQIQIRHTYNRRRNRPDNDRDGFEVRRAKLFFSGLVAERSWFYYIESAFSRSSGDMDLETLLLIKRLNEHVKLQFGQFKLPFMREDLISSRRQQAVDRTLVDGVFRVGRSQGVEVDLEFDKVQVFIAGHDGLREVNSPALERTAEWGVTGRVEVLIGDDWDQFDDFASWPGEDPALLLGAAIHLESDEYGTDNLEDEIVRWTADASLELGGANLFAAVMGRHQTHPTRPALNQYGVVAHAGVFVARNVDVFVRYEFGDADWRGEDLHLVTAGLNYYFDRHDLKLTVDVGYGLSEVDGIWDSRSRGWRADADGEEGQVVVRTQLQMLF